MVKNLEFESIMDELGFKGEKGKYSFANLNFTFHDGNLIVDGEVPFAIKENYRYGDRIEFKYENDFLDFLEQLLSYYNFNNLNDDSFKTVSDNFKVVNIKRISENKKVNIEDYNKLAKTIHKSNMVKNVYVDSSRTELEQLVSIFDEVVYSNMKGDELYKSFVEYDKDDDSFVYRMDDQYTGNYMLTIRGIDSLINAYSLDKDNVIIAHVIKSDDEYIRMHSEGEDKYYSIKDVNDKTNDLEYLIYCLKKSIFLSKSMQIANEDKRLVKKI